MSSMNPTRYAVAGVVAVVLAAGGYAIGTSNSGSDSAAASSAMPAGASSQSKTGQAPQNGQMPQGGQAPAGMGAPATGTAAKKAAAAALAKYKGTAEQVMKLDNGSYEVHVLTSKGEYHVAVSKSFKVTGVDQGGPGGRGAPGGGAVPRDGGTS